MKTENPPSNRSILRLGLRLAKRIVLVVLSLATLYVLVILIGLIPVNNGFRPADDGIEIIIISNSVHTDILLPIRTPVIDWRESIPPTCFRRDAPSASHITIGWGDKGFYIGTPTWADLRLSTALNALFWSSDTCLHVGLASADRLPEGARRISLSEEQYRGLVDFIDASFKKDAEDRNIQIAGAGYNDYDAFFEAHGTYHFLNTCNCWAGRAMQAGGIRTGWLTPLPKTPFLYLPDEG